jgi:hypothetical protein
MKGNVYGVDGSDDVRESLVYVYETRLLMGTWKQQDRDWRWESSTEQPRGRCHSEVDQAQRGSIRGRRSMCCRESRLEGQPEKTPEVSSEIRPSFQMGQYAKRQRKID